jgi:hypothetical protein
MSERAAALSIATESGTPSDRPAGLIARYRRDHTHPVNHFLHVGVGWPMAAVAVLLVPFRPLWSLGLFLLAYAIMFFGHFVFERNIPTVLKHPSTPFVVAWSVIRQLVGGLARLARPRRSSV